MNDLNTALAERNRLRRELDKAEREYKVQAELAAALVTVRSAGYSVLPPARQAPASIDHTRQAIEACNSVGVHSGQARPAPIPRAEYVPGREAQCRANGRARNAVRTGEPYEWRPAGNGNVLGIEPASPDWAVRQAKCDETATVYTLIHIPSGHETTGFPDYASLGQYIRARSKLLRTFPNSHKDWRNTYHELINADA